MLAGMMARPRGDFGADEFGGDFVRDAMAPKLSPGCGVWSEFRSEV